MNEMSKPTETKPTLFQPRPEPAGMLVTQASRQAQEVQAAMVVAKRFPRDEYAAMQRIERACQRRGLAETAVYAYPKGGQTVTGPSIRLAECLAQNWGNVDFGVIELEQRDGESTVMAYAWDLETNTRQTKVFSVRHERKARGSVVRLEDPRDIYELVANQGARRLRACVLGVIPGDVVETAMAACEHTLASDSEPLAKRVHKMVSAFGEMGVTAEMLADRLGHKLDVTTEAEAVQLRRIFTSLRDGMAKREQFFKLPVAGPKFDASEAKAEAEAGLGPLPPKESPPGVPVPPLLPQVRLAELVTGAGYTFEDFREWAHKSNWIENARALESFEHVPDKTAERFLKAKKGLLQGLAHSKGGSRE
jgi:hypothetical protein